MRMGRQLQVLEV